MIVHTFPCHQIGDEIEGDNSRNRANEYLAKCRGHHVFGGDDFVCPN